MQEDINPEDIDKDLLFAIADFEKLTINLRREATFEYLCENLENNPKLSNLFSNGEIEEQVLDVLGNFIIPYDECLELIKENLKKEDDELLGSINILIDITEKIKKRIFINTCKTLEKEGILELVFDGEKEDFSWRLKKEE